MKRYRPEWEEHIEGLGNFLYNIRNSSILELNGSIPSARDLTYVILKKEKEISGPVREGVIAYPGEGNILIRNFPAIVSGKLAEEAARAHADGNEFYIDREKADKYLKIARMHEDNLENSEAIFLRNNFPIQIEKFPEDKRIRFLFRDMKNDIADLLERKGIKEINFYADSREEIDSHTQPYANQLWMSLFSRDMSGFSGNYQHLHIREMIHALVKDNPIPTLAQ